MSRFSHWAFNGVVAVSLLLLLATCALWGCSYQAPWARSIQLTGRTGPNGGIEDGTEIGWNIASNQGVLHIKPFYSFFSWDTPYWKLVVLWSIGPACRLIPWHLLSRRKRRISRGHCAECGYDLFATPGRCPECGAVPKVTAAR